MNMPWFLAAGSAETGRLRRGVGEAGQRRRSCPGVCPKLSNQVCEASPCRSGAVRDPPRRPHAGLMFVLSPLMQGELVSRSCCRATSTPETPDSELVPWISVYRPQILIQVALVPLFGRCRRCARGSSSQRPSWATFAWSSVALWHRRMALRGSSRDLREGQSPLHCCSAM